MKTQNKSIKLDSSKYNIWFSSDLHLAHENIIKFCDRPFKDVNEMNKAIIDNWNSVVTPQDIAFILGDFCFGSQQTWIHFFNRLNGQKFLVIGNHDKSIAGNWAKIDHIMNLLIKDKKIDDQQRITLCHYPMLSWYQSHRGSWMLYGHLHGKLTNENLSDNKYDIKDKVSPNHLDVGTDAHNFMPISYEQVKEIITKQNMK